LENLDAAIAHWAKYNTLMKDEPKKNKTFYLLYSLAAICKRELNDDKGYQEYMTQAKKYKN